MEPTYTPLPSTRTDLGYNWIEQTVDEVLAFFAGYLKRNGAKAYVMDVYATNNQVYRNITIQLPEQSEVFPAENIHIQFNREEGRQMSLSLTTE